MQSYTTARFRKAFAALPVDIRMRARAAYMIWREDPHHSSLEFKPLSGKTNIYSVRIGLRWRALGVKKEDVIIWFWIGSHADYDKLISSL